MQAEQLLTLPADPQLLEEINLPPELAARMAGHSVPVHSRPEQQARRHESMPTEEDGEYFIMPDGEIWSRYMPEQFWWVSEDGSTWRVPRRWIAPVHLMHVAAPETAVMEAHVFMEHMHLPTFPDQLEINIPASRIETGMAQIEVALSSTHLPKVYWKDREGDRWRFPHDWRRRRIQLPDTDRLFRNGVPMDVAEQYGLREVSVNYHPGSLCCDPRKYRFRDEEGQRYEVNITDCIMLGYGDGPPSSGGTRQ